MNITERILKLELKRAACCVATLGAEYAKTVSIGRCNDKLLREASLVTGYIETLKKSNIQSDLITYLNFTYINWQSNNTMRLTFLNPPSFPLPDDINTFSTNDSLYIQSSKWDVNTGTFPITKINDLVSHSGLGAVDVNTITYQSGYNVRYAFNGSPNLSSVSVGDSLTVTLATNSVNNGTFRIVAVNDVADYVDIVNVSRNSAQYDEATDSPAVADIQQMIYFIEYTNSSITSSAYDEIAGTIGDVYVYYGLNPYTDEEMKNILEHINEICDNCGKNYLITS